MDENSLSLFVCVSFHIKEMTAYMSIHVVYAQKMGVNMNHFDLKITLCEVDLKVVHKTLKWQKD